MTYLRSTTLALLVAGLATATAIAQNPPAPTAQTQNAQPQAAPQGGRGGRGGAQGGEGGQGVVGGVGAGRGRNTAPPKPAPRNAEGRVVLGGATPAEKGVWLPVFGILDPIAPVTKVPFQPWSRAVYDDRQKNELEPHTRCKPSGVARQFLTPYGVEFVELPEL